MNAWSRWQLATAIRRCEHRQREIPRTFASTPGMVRKKFGAGANRYDAASELSARNDFSSAFAHSLECVRATLSENNLAK
jgi:hypothetical protein